MGNYRFKLSDMIPNAWFYKLHKEINRSSSNNTLPLPLPSPAPAAASTKKKHHLLQHLPDLPPPPTQPNNHSPSSSHLARKSYYFPRSTSQPSSATASVDSSTTTTTKTHHHCSPDSSSSSSASSSSILLFESSPELRLDRILTPETTSLCEYGPAATDLVVHDNSNFLPDNNNNKQKQLDDMLDELELELPRILTKPAAVKLNDVDDCIYSLKRSSSSSTHKNKTKTKSSRSKKVQLHNNNNIRTSTSTPRKLSVLSPGRKIKIRSSKIDQARRISTSQTKKRPLSDSFAIVKSSFDPQRDFRESMLEMIVEHNIKGSKDLEDLLACYLSLNSDEYHHLIIKVFKQIWFDLTNIN